MKARQLTIQIISEENCLFTPELVWTRGLGGAEYALVFMAEELGKMGHKVTIYNSVPAAIEYGHVTYRPVQQIDWGEAADLSCIFRVPIARRPPNAERVVFFSCDQYTTGDWRGMFHWIDAFICISQYHASYISANYAINAQLLRVCELGVNWPDYVKALPKVKNQMIYCSIPHRGLQHLFRLWPHIMARVPDATLVVTSDYTLWGRSNDPANHEFRAQVAGLKNVTLLGAVPRAELVRYQLTSELQVYPAVYDENFCISAAECIAAGAVPVTTPIGALPTTVNGSGIVTANMPGTPEGDREFLDGVAWLVEHPEEREAIAKRGRQRIREHYTFTAVAKRFLEASGFGQQRKEAEGA